MAIFSYYGNLSINLAFICLFEVVFIETEHHDNQIDLKNIPQEVRENTNALKNRYHQFFNGVINHMHRGFLKKCIILLGHTHDKILEIMLLLVTGCLALVRFLEIVPVEAAHYDYQVNLKLQ